MYLSRKKKKKPQAAVYNKQSHNNTRLGLYSCQDFTFPFESIRPSVHFGFTSQELLLSRRGTGKRESI